MSEKNQLVLKNTSLKVFYKEDDALLYLSENPDKNLLLYSEDASEKGSKRFYTISSENIFKLSHEKKFNLYENYSKTDKVKLILDIDIKKEHAPKDIEFNLHYFNTILDTSIDLVTAKLKDHNIKNTKIIILTAHRAEKFSSHVIFQNVHFENIYKMGYFMKQLNSPLIDNGTIDLAIYKKGSFRMLWNSKLGKNNNLEFHKGINYKHSDDKQLFFDCLVRNISNDSQLVTVDFLNIDVKNEPKKHQDKKEQIDKIAELEEDQLENDNCIDLGNKKNLFIDLLELLSVKRLTDYNTWINVIFLCRTYNMKEEALRISNKSPCFEKNKQDTIKSINTIFRRKIPKECLKLGSLVRWAREDSKDHPINYLNIMRKHNIRVKPLMGLSSADYLCYGNVIPKDFIEDTIHVSDEAINIMCDAILKHIKAILIQSPTGVGKTTATNKLINFFIKKYGKASIMSIVSRRSMIYTHLNAFKQLNLESYLKERDLQEGYICSLEYLSAVNIETYDIIVLDESNSLVKHLYSKTMNGKRLQALINLGYLVYHAKLIICCDATITNLVHNLISSTDAFGQIFYYQNICKNKKGVKMTIYTSSKDGENDKVKSFINTYIMQHAVKKESLIIFCDSKQMTYKVEYYMRKTIKDDSYIVVINSDQRTEDDFINFNTKFLNKCVIVSPSVVYGLDVLIEYENIYAIYKYNKNKYAMGALEYYQQIGRARNCKNAHVLVIDKNYDETYGSYITPEENIKLEDEEYASFEKQHNEICKKHNTINELCSKVDFGGKQINKDSIFANIHYFKTWIDRIFGTNKIMLFEKLCEEQGYEITHQELEVTEDGYGLSNINTIYHEKILMILGKLFKKEDITEDEKRLSINLSEQLQSNARLLGKDLRDLNENDFIILTDKKKLNSYLNKKYLDLTKEDLEITQIKCGNKELTRIANTTQIFTKINTLFWLEELVGIKRYKIDDINKQNELDKIKDELRKNWKMISQLDDYVQSSNKAEIALTKKINKIVSNNLLQKFVADCYNKLGDIIKYTVMKKWIIINKKTHKITTYNNFHV